MSLTKRTWMDDPLGFTDIKKWVCDKCVSDQILARLVAANLESASCSYCNAHSHEMIVAPFATVMAHIYHTVLHYYADASDVGAPWEGGGWVLPDVEPIEILEKLETEWGDAFQEDILRCLGRSENYWIAHSGHDWSLENPTKALASGWQAFVDTVRHKTRYLFLSEPVDEWDMGRPDEIPVAAVLDTLGNLVTNLNLITRLDCGTVCYRARDGHYKEFLDVSVPPKDQAGAGRMSPVGIPYLYVALERETARREIKPEKQEGYTLATLKTTKPLSLLNLADLPALPSIFDFEKYSERHHLQFLYNFREEICQPVMQDEKEHLEYIPTQIISEFFRYRFTYQGEKLDGILFNSSLTGGKNVTLFVSDHEEVEKIMEFMDLENHPAEQRPDEMSLTEPQGVSYGKTNRNSSSEKR